MAAEMTPQTASAIQECADARRRILGEVHKVIVGQDRVIDELLSALFADGHCLLVGVPGLAKTLLISTLARVLDLRFNRIQFTPDLMPSDITGTEILEEDRTTGKRAFKFVRGPVFANLILADEINRTPPKTQAALLQAMQEKEVTAAGHTFPLEPPFFVLATQNPIELEGTYPLPEAQLDRFMYHISVDYPGEAEEVQIVSRTTGPIEGQVETVLAGADILRIQKTIRRVPVSDHVISYAVRIAQREPSGNDDPAVREGLGELGRRPQGIAVPDPGREDPRRPERQPHTVGGGCTQRRGRRPAASYHHELQRRGGGNQGRPADLQDPGCRARTEASLRRREEPRGPHRSELQGPPGSVFPVQAPRPGHDRAAHRRRIPDRAAQEPLPRLQRRVRRTPAVHGRGSGPPRGLEGLRQERPFLHQEVRAGDEPPRPHPAGRLQLDAVRRRGADREAALRNLSLRRPRLPDAPAAGRRGASPLLRQGPQDHPGPERQDAPSGPLRRDGEGAPRSAHRRPQGRPPPDRRRTVPRSIWPIARSAGVS